MSSISVRSRRWQQNSHDDASQSNHLREIALRSIDSPRPDRDTAVRVPSDADRHDLETYAAARPSVYQVTRRRSFEADPPRRDLFVPRTLPHRQRRVLRKPPIGESSTGTGRVERVVTTRSAWRQDCAEPGA